MTRTLCIDIGGTGLKAAICDDNGNMVTERIKIKTPYPNPPEKLIESLHKLTNDIGKYDRISVGFPGLVREGVVHLAMAFSRTSYGGPIDETLRSAWVGFNLQTALEKSFNKPVRVANDADVQGCAVATGKGFEFVMTLGTGVGGALFLNGALQPHLELGHAPFRKGETFEQQLGNVVRKEIGNERWIKRVLKAIPAYEGFLFFDHLHIGGGNAKYLSETPLPENVSIVSNTAGLLGGVRIWDLTSH
jgi:polyphosphate glucokinase